MSPELIFNTSTNSIIAWVADNAEFFFSQQPCYLRLPLHVPTTIYAKTKIILSKASQQHVEYIIFRNSLFTNNHFSRTIFCSPWSSWKGCFNVVAFKSTLSVRSAVCDQTRARGGPTNGTSFCSDVYVGVIFALSTTASLVFLLILNVVYFSNISSLLYQSYLWVFLLSEFIATVHCRALSLLGLLVVPGTEQGDKFIPVLFSPHLSYFRVVCTGASNA